MKRSEINKALRELEAMCHAHHCYLPPFCHFTPEQWRSLGHEYDEIRHCMLAGISPTTVWGILTNSVSPSSPSVTATGP